MVELADTFLYFAYGSNMSFRRLTAPERAPSATKVAVGYVVGRRLVFHKLSRDKSGKCDCEPTGDAADRVYGVLYRVRSIERHALDVAEGMNYGYRQDIVEVLTEQGTYDVLTYVAMDTRTGLPVYEWYRRHVLIGAVENGLPYDYIERIRQVAVVPDPCESRTRRELAIYA